MNSSLTDATGLNMTNYFEELNTSESVKYSEIQFDSKYYDLENLNKSKIGNNNLEYKGIHINIHSLPSKFEQLKEPITNIGDLGIQLDFNLLCETFLSEPKCNLYKIPGY